MDSFATKNAPAEPVDSAHVAPDGQPVDNALLSQTFIDDVCLTQPLPTQWPSLAAAALPKRLLQRLLIALTVCTISFAASHRVFAYIDWPLIVLPLLFVLALWLALVPLQLRHCRYVLRQRDFIYCHGLLWRKADLLPLRRVQHVTVSQGAIQKLFDLATLELYSAGSSGAEIKLADITHHEAMVLSELLSALITQDEPPLAAVTSSVTPPSAEQRHVD